jgi:peroxiredoxin
MEACSFRDAKAQNITFKRHPELEVVGISHGELKPSILPSLNLKIHREKRSMLTHGIDNTAKLNGFADENNLPYMLISDKDGKARQTYGVKKDFLGLVEGKYT